MLSKDFREFVELLNKNSVEYLIVGGYAVGLHGHPRYTGDLDIWIDSSESNAKRTCEVLEQFGFGSFGLTVKDFTKEGNVIQLGYPPFRIDILTSIDGVRFSEAYQRKLLFDLNGLEVKLISHADLIINKTTTGRPRDIDDINNLR